MPTQQRPPEPPQGTQPSLWRLFLVVGGLMAAYYLFAQAIGSPGDAALDYSYSEFKHQVRAGRVHSVTIEGQSIRGWLTEARTPPDADEPKSKRFTSTRPPFEDESLLEVLETHGVEVRAKADQKNWWTALLVSILPWVLILGVLFYASRKMRERAEQMGPGGGMFGGFGRSRAKRYEKTQAETSFAEVAGLENAKRDLQEIIDYLREPHTYRSLGAKSPRGVLLMGPPGTGKTLLARAAAGEADVPFFSISGSEFIEMFVGVGASRVRDMFKEAKQNAPAIIFIDEIDSIGRARGTGLGGGHDEREQTLNQILSEMDGFSPHEAVVVLAGTNRPDVLDPALLRPGRFDRKITLELPRREARKQILEVHARKIKLGDDVDLDKLARATVGFSGADLENFVNEAALYAARKRKDQVNALEFEEARDKVLMGDRREGTFSDAEREWVAYHEAGHALLAALLPHADPIRKVTVIPRGHALGATEQMPEEDRHNLTQSEALDRIAVALGGRVAEQMIYGERTSGADNDLKQATRLAQRMITHWGMSDRVGPASFRYGDEHVFLGREMAAGRKDFSEHTARVIDEEVQRIVGEMEGRAQECLQAHRDALEKLSRALLESETVESEEIQRILEESGGADSRAGHDGSSDADRPAGDTRSSDVPRA